MMMIVILLFSLPYYSYCYYYSGYDIFSLPIGFMYDIFIHIWVIYRANVSKYSIHGASGLIHNQSI